MKRNVKRYLYFLEVVLYIQLILFSSFRFLFSSGLFSSLNISTILLQLTHAYNMMYKFLQVLSINIYNKTDTYLLLLWLYLIFTEDNSKVSRNVRRNKWRWSSTFGYSAFSKYRKFIAFPKFSLLHLRLTLINLCPNLLFCLFIHNNSNKIYTLKVYNVTHNAWSFS